MKQLSGFVIVLVALTTASWAGDLYRVPVTSIADADLLTAAGVEPVLRLTGAYLVIADTQAADFLRTSGPAMTVLAVDVSVDRLAFDNRRDRANLTRFESVYEEGDLRLLRIDAAGKALAVDGRPLVPVDNSRLSITYQPPLYFNEKVAFGDISLDSLIAPVSQDSIYAYLKRLEDFNGRVTGSDSAKASRDWIAAKFASFGYDSVTIDTFRFPSSPDSATGYNVIAYKVGSRFPGRHLIVGGHYDAVLGSPGADDNGSGTVGTLEMARVLRNVETEMTFIFIAFDAEEGGLRGSNAYADRALDRGDTIHYMFNMDMIGHITNTDLAALHQGPDDEPYANLWSRLADSLVGIVGVITGPSSSSDHYPFAQNGYDVTFLQEYIFSPNWHKASDSTTNINFDYMTRMVKGAVAATYVVNRAPKPVVITSVRDVGNGQSLQVNWVPHDPGQVDHYWLHYTTIPPVQPDSILVPVDSASYIVDMLTEGQEYSFYMIAVDVDGRTSIGFTQKRGTPNSIPIMPENLVALPIKDAIKLSWSANNSELDFHHYTLIRDGQLFRDSLYDTSLTDFVGGLDTLMHAYFVVAVDSDGNKSDTAGTDPASMKAARLTADRVLAVNRSGSNATALVNEVVTGEFMREALQDWSFVYHSDTAAANPDRANLLKMIDYGLVVVGAESGRQDDIGALPALGGILGDIGYYLSIGGKVIIFGRWGDIDIDYDVDTVYYSPSSPQFAYSQYFNIMYRVLPLTFLDGGSIILQSDFIGAHALAGGYPDLVWDSVATLDHTGPGFNGVTGIPCPSYPFLAGSGIEVIYRYNSSSDSILTEGKSIAWRKLGGSTRYVFFDIPLSFMQRPAAVAALRQAVNDLQVPTSAGEEAPTASLPRQFDLSQNYPNPFNLSTVIEFYNPGPRPAEASLEVFNILGQKIRVLFDGLALPGLNRIEWDGRDGSGRQVATGIYFYRLKTADDTATRKMVLLK